MPCLQLYNNYYYYVLFWLDSLTIVVVLEKVSCVVTLAQNLATVIVTDDQQMD